MFSQPFSVNWIFDVEILARCKIVMQAHSEKSLEEVSVEYPLERWQDIPGSKISGIGMWSASLDMLKLACLLHAPFIAKNYANRFSA